MKRVISNSTQNVYAMANLDAKNTGLKCIIWVDSFGARRNGKHSKPRVKLEQGKYSASVLVSDNPVILAQTNNIPHSVEANFKDAMKYIARNSDLFLDHYYNKLTDADLMFALKERGELK